MSGLRRTMVITGIGVAIGGLAGCSGPETAAKESNNNPSPTSTVVPSNKKSGVPDTNVYPAPPGVKTGIEGGKKD